MGSLSPLFDVCWYFLSLTPLLSPLAHVWEADKKAWVLPPFVPAEDSTREKVCQGPSAEPSHHGWPSCLRQPHRSRSLSEVKKQCIFSFWFREKGWRYRAEASKLQPSGQTWLEAFLWDCGLFGVRTKVRFTFVVHSRCLAGGLYGWTERWPSRRIFTHRRGRRPSMICWSYFKLCNDNHNSN